MIMAVDSESQSGAGGNGDESPQELGHTSMAALVPGAPRQAESGPRVVCLTFLLFSISKWILGLFFFFIPCRLSPSKLSLDEVISVLYGPVQTETLSLRGLHCKTCGAGLCSPCPNCGEAEWSFWYEECPHPPSRGSSLWP